MSEQTYREVTDKKRALFIFGFVIGIVATLIVYSL
jgi:hypothetical protein